MRQSYNSTSKGNMGALGLDLGDKRNIAQRRTKRGECPTCGTRTHKMGMFGKKTPLTIEGKCASGVCLRCNQIEGYQQRPPPPPVPPPPRSIRPGVDIIVDDNISTVSGLTMDHDLIAAGQMHPAAHHERYHPQAGMMPFAEGVEEEYDYPDDYPPPAFHQMRPEPSIGTTGIVEREPHPSYISMDQVGTQREHSYQQQTLERSHRSGARSPMRDSIGRREMDAPGRRLRGRRSPIGLGTPPVRDLSPRRDDMVPVRMEDHPSPAASSKRNSSESGSYAYPQPVAYPQEPYERHERQPPVYMDHSRDPRRPLPYEPVEEQKTEIEAPEEFGTWQDGGGGGSRQYPNGNWDRRGRSPPPQQYPQQQPPRELQFVPDDFDDEAVRKPAPPRDVSSVAWSKAASIEPPAPPFSHFGRGSQQQQKVEEPVVNQLAPPRARRKPEPQQKVEERSVSDIPTIIQQLNANNVNAKHRENAFQSLAETVWNEGNEAKLQIKRCNGIDAVVSSMWDDLTNPGLQTAAIELLFALSAADGEDPGSDVLVGDGAGNAVDALLISMQSNISLEKLQQAGCGALSCLASASSRNKMVDDGTLSGAVSCVIGAMNAHRQSEDVQKWGLRALYCQCVLSVNAEGNRLTLAGGGEEDGMAVIHKALEVNCWDMACVEWGCRLYWCLAFSEKTAAKLADSRALSRLISSIRNYEGKVEASGVMEAAYGALLNISKVKQDIASLRKANIITRLFETMNSFQLYEGVNIEACSVLAYLAEHSALREAIVNNEGIQHITRALNRFPRSVALQEAGMRAFLCLSMDFEEAKAALSSEKSLKLIMNALDCFGDSFSGQELVFSLLGSLCIRKLPETIAMTFDAMILAMNENATERRLQEAVCLALRNISCQELGLQQLPVADIVTSLMYVMEKQTDSEIVQINACCVLWKIAESEQEGHASAIEPGCINQIVEMLQLQMESAAVVEMACGALLSLIADSEENKKCFADSGGVDYMKTSLLMHPQEPSTLEMACGVLASMSGTPEFVGAVAEAQGISTVVEVMRANSMSLELLEVGCLILRNVVVEQAEYASEASNAISIIIGGIKGDLDAVAFQTEGCYALWALAAQSEDCKQKILALDGMSALMHTMDHNNDVSEVREAAHGAFSLLTAMEQ